VDKTLKENKACGDEQCPDAMFSSRRIPETTADMGYPIKILFAEGRFKVQELDHFESDKNFTR
jgi:hypothetical protein